MPILTIDHHEVEVPEGTKVIAAAERLGIMIPRFCYHPALGAVGACRVCAVKVVEGYCPGIQMSCMIDVADGMVVSTTDPEAVAFRKSVIEWLMVNHPHDCPVCDEGGHCLLQEMTVSGGHGQRRYGGKKRTHVDQDLGLLVRHEMNRCIQCYRCTRFYREFAGYEDLGVLGIGSRVYFGRRQDGTLESPFSGNLIDICPTGVYTDKPSRFKGRRWDFERSDSICIHCALGCNTVASARYREIVRQEARFNRSVNGHFICDRGRYGFHFTGDTGRPRSPLMGGEKTDSFTVMEALSLKIREITGKAGSEAVAVAVSHRSTLETVAAARYACRLNRWTGPSCFTDAALAEKLQTAVACLGPDQAVSLAEIPSADFVLAVGTDPLGEAPMVAMAMRQAHRNGAEVVLVDPRPVDLPMAFRHLPLYPGQMADFLAALICETTGPAAAETIGHLAARFREDLLEAGETGAALDAAASVADALKKSRRPVIICGTDLAPVAAVRMSAALSVLMGLDKPHAGLFYLMPGANSFAAALGAGGTPSLESIIEGIEGGRIKALILVENDPLWYFPDPARVERALAALELLVVVDYLASSVGEMADLFLPSTTVFETGGMFINQEGRVQRALPGFAAGSPVLETGGGGHPPRTFRHDVPGGSAQPAHELLCRLVGLPASPMKDGAVGSPGTWLGEIHPKIPMPGEIPPEGIRVSAADPYAPFTGMDSTAEDAPDDGFTMVTTEATFGTEELSRHAACLEENESSPVLYIHDADARAMGFSDGDRIQLTLASGSLEVILVVKHNMAKGVLVLPRHHRTDWQKVGREPLWISREQINKTSDMVTP